MKWVNDVNGQKIKNIRLSKKLGLNETARKAGISGSYLSNIEKGIKTNPSTDTLQKIADVLEVSVNEFFDDDTENKSDNKGTEFNPKLSVKEQEKLDKQAEELINELTISLSQNKDHLTDKDYDVLLASMKGALQAMTIRNKKKYTPKKYRNKN